MHMTLPLSTWYWQASAYVIPWYVWPHLHMLDFRCTYVPPYTHVRHFFYAWRAKLMFTFHVCSLTDTHIHDTHIQCQALSITYLGSGPPISDLISTSRPSPPSPTRTTGYKPSLTGGARFRLILVVQQLFLARSSTGKRLKMTAIRA